ncbi:MAG: hypothetical protein HYZ72_00675 [Deltaproteobacteria bacterium]|nr:hypothetical protein [Deltaproteobacteria bacterium]
MNWSRSKWGAGLLLLCFAGGWVQPVAGEEKASGGGQQGKAAPDSSLVDSLSLTSRREPIHIRSRDLEFRYNDKRILYRGDVVVTQGDVTVKSDLLTVTYEEPAAAPGATPEGTPPKPASVTSRQRLKEIVAEGHVEITTGDRRATGKKAVFDEAHRTVVLSGDAVLQEGGNQVTGERVTVFLDEKRSVVEGGGGDRRAEMVFIPQQQEDGKKGAKTP